MKNSVILKSYSNGISIILDDTIPFEELLQEIAAKFRDADKFFKDAAIVISLEGRVLTESQEREILDTITQNSHLRVLSLVGKDEEKNIRFTKLQNSLMFQEDENCGQFYKGSLTDGETIETENSIVILGDVNEGCGVYSSKDIVILGKLAGKAYAGAGGNSNHFVVALEMEPATLRIGEFTYESERRKKRKWGPKQKVVPKIAYCHNGKVLTEEITKELLDNFTL